MILRTRVVLCASLIAVASIACSSEDTSFEDGDSGQDPAETGGGAGMDPTETGGSGDGDSGGDMTTMPIDGVDDLPTNAEHPYIQYYGRWNHADPGGPVAMWGGVYLHARFSGTSLSIELTDEQLTVDGGVGTGNVYQYRIDEGEFVELRSSAATSYELASGLAEGEHSLTFVRRTESKFGTTTFRGFTLDDGAHLLPPLVRPQRRVEIFGDSISAGLANENRGDYRNINENGYEAFGPQMARLFDAEWRVEARGGGSLLQATWLPMIPWFDKMYGPRDLQHLPDDDVLLWDFDVWQPDVFILALGTNDSSEMYPADNEGTYVAKYQGFLTAVRGYYPEAEIFGVAPWKEGAPWDLVRSHIRVAIESMDDAKVHAVIPISGTEGAYTDRWLETPADYVNGDEYHPNIEGNQKIAARLAAVVGPIMGWD